MCREGEGSTYAPLIGCPAGMLGTGRVTGVTNTVILSQWWFVCLEGEIELVRSEVACSLVAHSRAVRFLGFVIVVDVPLKSALAPRARVLVYETILHVFLLRCFSKYCHDLRQCSVSIG